MANMAFIYPLAGDIDKYFSNVEKVGLSCREFNCENVLKIKQEYINPIVYVSLGRTVDLQKEIDVNGLSYDFIYTEGIKMKGNNTHFIPVDTPNTQDYILAADYIISKAGWGTIAEGICAQKPMLVIKRDEILEDRNTLEKLLELNVVLPILVEQLNCSDISQLLEKLKYKKVNYKFLSDIYNNCSNDISRKILSLL